MLAVCVSVAVAVVLAVMVAAEIGGAAGMLYGLVMFFVALCLAAGCFVVGLGGECAESLREPVDGSDARGAVGQPPASSPDVRAGRSLADPSRISA